MIARGLSGAGNTSGVPFNGARTSDLSAALTVIRAAAPPSTPLVGVGYSMGAIVLTHYCGVAGADNPLSCAIAISGSPDVVHASIPHAQRLWQPALAHELKRTFLRLPCLRDGSGVAPVDAEYVLSHRCPNITEFDGAVVVPHFGFDSLFGERNGYYRTMSLVHGDQASRVSMPLLLVHACDDPIVDSRSYHSVIEGGAQAANPNIWTRMTRHGGHVGWCEGWWPTPNRWSFMCRQVEEFADAVLADDYQQREGGGGGGGGGGGASQPSSAAASSATRRRPQRSPSRRAA
jgi:predicted alpha/beta-fold hydrolase